MAKKRKKSSIKISVLSLILAVLTVLFVAGLFFENKFTFQIISFIAGGIFLAYEASIGLVLKPKRTDGVWALPALMLLIFLRKYTEAQITLILYLIYFLILNVFKEQIKYKGEKFHLSYGDFAKDCARPIKVHTSLTLPFAMIIAVIAFVMIKNSTEVLLYSFALALIAFSLYYYYDLLSALYYFGVIKLAKQGIYVNEAQVLGNKFYDTVLLEDEGVITDGDYEILEVRAFDDYTKEEIVELLAYAHYYSDNLMRDVFIDTYGKKIYPNLISDYKEDDELGISLTLAEDVYRVGELPLIKSIGVHPVEPDICQIVYYILKNEKQIGCVEIGSHMRDNLTNPIEILKSAYASKILVFAGNNLRLAKRVCAGAGLDIMEPASYEKKDIFDAIRGKALYVDGMDEKQTFDASKYDNVTLVHIGEDIMEEPDYDIWIPHGSVETILSLMEECEEFANIKTKFFFLYFMLKIIFAIFILTMKINSYYILTVEIVFATILIFATRSYGQESDISK